MPSFAWADFDGDDLFGVVAHGVSVAGFFGYLLHVVADGVAVMEFGDFVSDCIRVLAGGEAVDDEGVTLGEDACIEGSRLLCGHDEGEAGSASLTYPFDE